MVCVIRILHRHRILWRRKTMRSVAKHLLLLLVWSIILESGTTWKSWDQTFSGSGAPQELEHTSCLPGHNILHVEIPLKFLVVKKLVFTRCSKNKAKYAENNKFGVIPSPPVKFYPNSTAGFGPFDTCTIFLCHTRDKKKHCISNPIITYFVTLLFK